MEITVALIGVGGVVIGTLLSEISHYIREKSTEREILKKYQGYLVAAYYELSANLEFISNLEKLEVSTYAKDARLNTKTEMLSILRQYYDKLPQPVIGDIELAYSRMSTLIFEISTNPHRDYENWKRMGKETVELLEAARSSLRQIIADLGLNLSQCILFVLFSSL